MKFEINPYSKEEFLRTGITDIDDAHVDIHFMNGYGATDIAIGDSGGITWQELDKLKEAIKLAEQRWRPNHGKTTNI